MSTAHLGSGLVRAMRGEFLFLTAGDFVSAGFLLGVFDRGGSFGVVGTGASIWVREWPSPGGPNSGPYGIAALGDVVWYSESGVKPNTLVRFDTRIEKFESWTIPSGGGVVRNMATTRDGKVVLACSGVDRIALVDTH